MRKYNLYGYKLEVYLKALKKNRIYWKMSKRFYGKTKTELNKELIEYKISVIMNYKVAWFESKGYLNVWWEENHLNNDGISYEWIFMIIVVFTRSTLFCRQAEG